MIGLYNKTTFYMEHLAAQQWYQVNVKRYTIIHKQNRVKTPLALGGFWYAPGLIYKDSVSAHEKMRYISLGYSILDKQNQSV